MRRALDPAEPPKAWDNPACKPYLSVAELAELTPWTNQAIRTMVSRGVFREVEHYSYVGRRPVFKWAAIVAFVERGRPRERVPHYREQMNLSPESEKSAAKPVRSK